VRPQYKLYESGHHEFSFIDYVPTHFLYRVDEHGRFDRSALDGVTWKLSHRYILLM
jgi:hypothetical protein